MVHLIDSHRFHKPAWPQPNKRFFLNPNLHYYWGSPTQNRLSKIELEDLIKRQSVYFHNRNKISKKRSLLYFFARLCIPMAVTKIEKFLNTHQPDLLIFFNRETPFHTLLRYLSDKRQIPQLFLEGGFVPGTIEFDSVGNDALSWPARNPKDFNELSISANDRETAETHLKNCRDKKLSRKIQTSSNIQKKITAYFGTKPVLFFAGTNERGTGIYATWNSESKIYSPFFSGNQEAVLNIAKIAKKRGWGILFKPHPNESDFRIKYLFPSDLPILVDHKANIFDCIQISKLVVTIGSGVAGVSLIQGKAAILLGKTALYRKGAAYELNNREELEDVLSEAMNQEHGLTEKQQTAWNNYVSRTIRYYSFAANPQIETTIGRGPKEAADMIINFVLKRSGQNR